MGESMAEGKSAWVWINLRYSQITRSFSNDKWKVHFLNIYLPTASTTFAMNFEFLIYITRWMMIWIAGERKREILEWIYNTQHFLKIRSIMRFPSSQHVILISNFARTVKQESRNGRKRENVKSFACLNFDFSINILWRFCKRKTREKEAK